jgi:NAD(P)-dependent dehydrogenase (short-subunit alcohol dehydrogenase family)
LRAFLASRRAREPSRPTSTTLGGDDEDEPVEPAGTPSRGAAVLAGRVAIVTGASRGIGAATARAFVTAGAAVALAARDQAALTSLAKELESGGGEAIAVPTDVADPASVQHLVQRTVASFGRLDLAFNNAAGGGQPPTPLADLPVDAHDSAVAVSLRGCSCR